MSFKRVAFTSGAGLYGWGDTENPGGADDWTGYLLMQETAGPRSLTEHLTALFSIFFRDSPSREQLISLEVRWYALLRADLPVELPVLFIPPTAFTIPADWRPEALEAGATDAVLFIAALSERLTEWYHVRLPPTVNAGFSFELTAFSLHDRNTPRLVRARSFFLNVASVYGF